MNFQTEREQDRQAKRITVEMLKQHDVCKPQLRKFRKVFPAGAPVSVRSLAKAQKAGLDVLWAEHLLTGPTLAEYEKGARSASVEYKRATGPAWAEHEKLTRSAWAEYLRGARPAWAEYEKARRSALVESEKATRSASVEYLRATGSALVAALAAGKET